jgi:hypothetical protein
LAPQDFERLREEIVQVALDHAHRHGTGSVKGTIETIDLLSSSGVEGGWARKDSIETYLAVGRSESTPGLPNRAECFG